MHFTGTILRAAAGAAVFVLVLAAQVVAGGDWNDAGIDWQPYEAGLELADKENKPVCLVFYTDWCPHCQKYSGVFHDDEVVEMSKRFVMIRLNKDENAAISAKYAPDGEYIPRTYFLSSEAELDESITERRAEYKYFYDTTNPAGLLRGMNAALAAHGES